MFLLLDKDALASFAVAPIRVAFWTSPCPADSPGSTRSAGISSLHSDAKPPQHAVLQAIAGWHSGYVWQLRLAA